METVRPRRYIYIVTNAIFLVSKEMGVTYVTIDIQYKVENIPFERIILPLQCASLYLMFEFRFE